MIQQALATVVGLGSVALYGAAFFFPEVHRKHDFFWSGVGLFYALVLWVNAGQSQPTELLGHCAAISLVGWWGWQALTLRRRRTPLALRTPFTEDSWPSFQTQMAELGLAFVRQTALGRWLFRPRRAALAVGPGEGPKQLRASALKDVEYEFLDDLTPAARAPAARATPTVVSLARPRSQAATDSQPGAGRWQTLVRWLSRLGRSLSRPKPRRAIIDIPPRSPAPEAEPITENPEQPPAEADL